MQLQRRFPNIMNLKLMETVKITICQTKTLWSSQTWLALLCRHNPHALSGTGNPANCGVVTTQWLRPSLTRPQKDLRWMLTNLHYQLPVTSVLLVVRAPWFMRKDAVSATPADIQNVSIRMRPLE